MNNKFLYIIVGLLALVAVFIFVLNPFQSETPPPSEGSTEREESPSEMSSETEEEMVESEETMDENEMVETETTGYVDLSPQEAMDLIEEKPDLVIVDVSPKYEEGHIPGAVNYYVGDGTLDEALPTLDKTVPYLIYCHTDSASIAGAEKFVDAEFPEVYRLEGNYSAWVNAGYEVEIPSEE